MKLNYMRRKGTFAKGVIFPDKDWTWLDYIEPSACIAFRSIHMIEYVVEHARLNGHSACSLFVGEIHNSDIEWYAANRNALPEWLVHDRQTIKEKAIKAANSPSFIKWSQVKYLTFLSLGACTTWAGYVALTLGAMSLIN